MEKGLPGDPRFPERDNEYIEEQAKRNDLLLQWIEDFKSKFGQYEQAQSTIEEVDQVLELYNKVVGSVRIPLMIQNSRNARTKEGSVLEYGLEYHLNGFKSAVSIPLPPPLSLPLSIIPFYISTY